ncbi:hypothetical protein [Croceicoccus bisphenolivorans]|uniref:hypothetical protein n=1 Tax=Croceicoccus bisphenolivorans TaxID=1783232 RepID=UPI0008339262|nr:hypothetical protein [Croceicoccus bisphenolivorans]
MTAATISAPVQPWSGHWRLPKRAELRDGLYNVSQFTAMQLLQKRAPRDQWEGDFLQTVLLQNKPLGPGQRYWLDRLTREFEERGTV